MNLRHMLRLYGQKYYASGSPLRYLRKVGLEIANPGAGRLRSRLGAKIAAEIPPNLKQRLADLEATGDAEAGDEIDQQLLAELVQAAETKLAAGSAGTKLTSFFSTLTDEEDLRTDSI